MPTSLSLGDIEEALQQADPKTRHQTLRAVTDLFLSSAPQLDEGRIDVFDNVFESLLGESDLECVVDLSQRMGREAMESYREELTHLDRSLYHIARALSDGRIDPRALAIAADSVLNLRRRLDLIGHKIPSTMDSWDQINRMAERLDQLSTRMRGDVLETH